MGLIEALAVIGVFTQAYRFCLSFETTAPDIDLAGTYLDGDLNGTASGSGLTPGTFQGLVVGSDVKTNKYLFPCFARARGEQILVCRTVAW